MRLHGRFLFKKEQIRGSVALSNRCEKGREVEEG